MKRFGFDRLFHRQATKEEEATPPRQEVAAPARIKPNPGTTVLIVDDSKTIHVMISKLLTAAGYESLSAFDGESGVELARSHHPALVLMDVVMPGINGFEATRAIRRDPDPQLAAIPVIIISGNAQPTEQFWSAKIGANDFMTKPFNVDELFERIERLLYPQAIEAS